MVVRLPGKANDTVFWADAAAAKLYSFDGGTSASSTVPVVTTVLPTAPWGSMALGTVKAAAGAIDLLNGTSTPALFGYGAGSRIWAVDAASGAAGGTAKVYWNAPTQCADLNIPGTGLFVLGDGAVLHLCSSGILQAWEPNGDGAGNGKLRWQATGGGWSSLQSRSAVGQDGNTDVLYLLGNGKLYVTPIPRGSTSAPAPILVADVNSSISGCLSGSNTPTVLADAKGNAILGCTSAVITVSPAGVVLGVLNAGSNGLGLGLGADGLLYAESGTTLNGLQLDPFLVPSIAWSTFGPNNGSFGSDVFALLAGGRLAVSVQNAGPGKDLVFFNVSATGPAPAPAWSAWGGDNQHRHSVEALNAGPTGF
jgi:hypothetical protein